MKKVLLVLTIIYCLSLSVVWWEECVDNSWIIQSQVDGYNKQLSTYLAYYWDDTYYQALKSEINYKISLLEQRLAKAKNDYNTCINKATEDLKSRWVTNDILSWNQYYLKDLNITWAWQKTTNSNQVLVAIIDDWIYINHPDISKVWTNPSAKYWDSKIIDFVWDWMPSNMPVWEHWTMVAWVIGATIWNNEWVAWIWKNVMFMPLRVFDTKWDAKEENIIRAIKYAIDNWANIINLSLWNPMAYSDKYNDVIKQAYDKGITVVIAAWNWDVLSWQQTGLDLDKSPISPVCNNWGDSKYSIWVYASTKAWYRTSWTNYWKCAPFIAPWEQIVSTSIPLYNSNYWTNYNALDWTSFSAPIITWVIALWYNQYWYVPPAIIRDSLSASYVKNSAWNPVLDAAKYLDILGSKISIIKQEQINHNQFIQNETIGKPSSIGDYLANAGIINKQNSEADYHLNTTVLRQEVVNIALKLGWIAVPNDTYKCKNYFKDVKQVRPNTWACKVIEVAADNGLVNRANQKFRPEDRISKVEALAILARAVKINTGWISTSPLFLDVTESWQVSLTNKAGELDIIDKWGNFYPNQNATRWEIFEMAKRILINR